MQIEMVRPSRMTIHHSQPAVDEGVPPPAQTTAIYARSASRGEADFQGKARSALRYGFGSDHLKPSATQVRVAGRTKATK